MRNPIGDTSDTRRRRAPENLHGWMVDTHRANDLLDFYISQGLPKENAAPEAPKDEEIWLLNRREDPDYAAQMAAMHKTTVREGSQLVEKWKPVHDGSRYDYRHCEAYQVVAAYMANVHLLPPADELEKLRQQQLDEARQIATPGAKDTDRRREAWEPRPVE
jgi:hypothetical protein